MAMKGYPHYNTSSTVSYKGWHIHSHFEGSVEKTRIQGPDGQTIGVRSVHAAKCRITKELGK